MPAVLDRQDRITNAQWAAVVDDLTRRGFLRGTAGTAGLLTLAACGASPPSSSSASAATRKVVSVNGTITVPAEPKRVVTTDDYSMATLFDLNFAPVGVYSAGAQYVEPQYLARWQVIPKISAGSVGGAVNVEKVAALKPDLILGIDAAKPPYSDLKDIAPTVIMPFSKAAVPWSAMAADTANAVNRGSGLAALEKRYTEAAARIKATYAAVLARTRWDILQGGFNQGQYWLYGPQSSIGRILAAAGVRFASGSASVTAADGEQTLSYEEIGDLSSADAIYYYATNNGKPANYGPQLFAQPLFTELSAVKAGHLYGTVYFLPSSYGDAIQALDVLEKALARLQQGD